MGPFKQFNRKVNKKKPQNIQSYNFKNYFKKNSKPLLKNGKNFAIYCAIS